LTGVVRLNVVSVFFTRIIALYEGLGGSLEGGFRRFCLRAISHLMKSCLMRLVRLTKTFLLFFLFAGIIAFYDELFDTGGSLESSFCRFCRAHYHVLC
jgi:hypothetical protein